MTFVTLTGQNDDDDVQSLKILTQVNRCACPFSVYFRHVDCLTQTTVTSGVERCNTNSQSDVNRYIERAQNGYYSSADQYNRDLCG